MVTGKQLLWPLRSSPRLRSYEGKQQLVPTFDGKFVNYPRFKREWQAYRQTYHSLVSYDLAAKTLRENCVKGDTVKMIGHLDDLDEIWETLDTCFERPEKYMIEALQPILEFGRYRGYDNCAAREFYSLHIAAIKEAKAVGVHWPPCK